MPSKASRIDVAENCRSTSGKQAVDFEDLENFHKPPFSSTSYIKHQQYESAIKCRIDFIKLVKEQNELCDLLIDGDIDSLDEITLDDINEICKLKQIKLKVRLDLRKCLKSIISTSNSYEKWKTHAWHNKCLCDGAKTESSNGKISEKCGEADNGDVYDEYKLKGPEEIGANIHREAEKSEPPKPMSQNENDEQNEIDDGLQLLNPFISILTPGEEEFLKKLIAELSAIDSKLNTAATINTLTMGVPFTALGY